MLALPRKTISDNVDQKEFAAVSRNIGMPLQSNQRLEYLTCPVCITQFDCINRLPVSLACSHTLCRPCLLNIGRPRCPYDQTESVTDISLLPPNHALLQLLGLQAPESLDLDIKEVVENKSSFETCRRCVEELTCYLKLCQGNGASSTASIGQGSGSAIVSRGLQRKLVSLMQVQLVEKEGRCRALKAARGLGERAVNELILLHQNPHQMTSQLWAAVRSRGCQFLGPAMQEEVLKLILLALEDGSLLARKVLVLFVVQKLESTFAQASKTSIGHVVQLLYRASCFKVTKREDDSSLMQLHDKYRNYEELRKAHDSQIVHIAMESGLRLTPEQWSSILYGDDKHRSYMQSIIDKLQTPAAFTSSIQELVIALRRSGDSAQLECLKEPLQLLSRISATTDVPSPTWQELEQCLLSCVLVISALVDFTQNHHKVRGSPEGSTSVSNNSKYKTSMCRDVVQRGNCPRGDKCSFAHTGEELDRFRRKKGTCNFKNLITANPSVETVASAAGSSEIVPRSAFGPGLSGPPRHAYPDYGVMDLASRAGSLRLGNSHPSYISQGNHTLQPYHPFGNTFNRDQVYCDYSSQPAGYSQAHHLQGWSPRRELPLNPSPDFYPTRTCSPSHMLHHPMYSSFSSDSFHESSVSPSSTLIPAGYSPGYYCGAGAPRGNETRGSVGHAGHYAPLTQLSAVSSTASNHPLLSRPAPTPAPSTCLGSNKEGISIPSNGSSEGSLTTSSNCTGVPPTAGLSVPGRNPICWMNGAAEDSARMIGNTPRLDGVHHSLPEHYYRPTSGTFHSGTVVGPSVPPEMPLSGTGRVLDASPYHVQMSLVDMAGCVKVPDWTPKSVSSATTKGDIWSSNFVPNPSFDRLGQQQFSPGKAWGVLPDQNSPAGEEDHTAGPSLSSDRDTACSSGMGDIVGTHARPSCIGVQSSYSNPSSMIGLGSLFTSAGPGYASFFSA